MCHRLKWVVLSTCVMKHICTQVSARAVRRVVICQRAPVIHAHHSGPVDGECGCDSFCVRVLSEPPVSVCMCLCVHVDCAGSNKPYHSYLLCGIPAACVAVQYRTVKYSCVPSTHHTCVCGCLPPCPRPRPSNNNNTNPKTGDSHITDAGQCEGSVGCLRRQVQESAGGQCGCLKHHLRHGCGELVVLYVGDQGLSSECQHIMKHNGTQIKH